MAPLNFRSSDVSPPRQSRWGRYWHALTEPPPSVDAPLRDRARLLSGLLLVMMGLGMLSAGFLLLIAFGGGPVQSQNLAPALLSVGFMAFVYRLNRTGRYTSAASLTVAITNVAIWASLVVNPAALQTDSLPMAFLIIPVLLCGLLLSVPFTVTLAVINLIVVVLAHLAVPGRTVEALVYAMIFISMISVLIVVVAVLREQDRVKIDWQTKALTESSARFQAAFEHAAIGMSMVALDGHWLQVNRALCEMLGYSELELMATTFQALTYPDDLDASLNALRPLLTSEKRAYQQLEMRYLHKHGHVVWIRLSGALVRDEGDEPLYFVNQIQDITERKQAQAALHEANQKLTHWVAELEQRSHEIALLSDMGSLLQMCQSAEEAYDIISHFAGQLFPTEVGALYIVNPSQNYLEALTDWGEGRAELGGRIFAPGDCWALRQGRAYWVDDTGAGLLCHHVARRETNHPAEGSLCLPLTAQGETLGIFHLRLRPNQAQQLNSSSASRRALASTLAEQVALALSNIKLRETLRSQSIRDPLTGLFNRRYLQESLERELHRAERNHYQVGVIMIDVDHFKDFNDTFGHAAGDAVLRAFGEWLKTNIRGGDMACRYGGEEFVLILPEAPLDIIRQRAEQLRERAQELVVQHQGQALGVIHLSLGVAVFPEHGLTQEAVLQVADGALYRAKQAGRNRVVVAGEH